MTGCVERGASRTHVPRSGEEVSLRIAIISDVHGNLEALRRVLQDVASRGTDATVCLGDVVSFGPCPRECLETIAALPKAAWVRGNHDRYVGEEVFRTEGFVRKWPAGFVQNERWTHSRLDSKHLATLASWSPSHMRQVASTSLFFAHASSDSDEYLLWPNAPDTDFERALGVGGIRAYGHVHHQFCKWTRATAYLNPGSVGFPFDGDSRAAYALVTVASEVLSVDLVRVDYDVQATVAALRKERVPWLAHIRAALEQSVSFFSPQLGAVGGE